MVLKIKRDVDGYIHKDIQITAFKIEKNPFKLFSDKYGQLFPLCGRVIKHLDRVHIFVA